MVKSDKPLRELLDEFETIVAWFNGDNLDVEAATAKFVEGSELAEKIRVRLSEQKNQIEIVKKRFENAADDFDDDKEDDEAE